MSQPSPEQRWVPGVAPAADGVPLSFWTSGEGSPLLLIAGQAVDHRSWRRTAERLATGRKLVVFDHRGIGQSGSGSQQRFTTRQFADDVARVLDAADIGRADVLGHSMGGRVAQWLAVDHPGRVDRLVLVATSAGDHHGPARAPEVDLALRSGDLDRLAPLFYGDRVDLEATRGLLSVGGDRTARARHFRASRSHDALEDLALITARTLVLHGELDRLTPVEHARIVARHIPLSRLMILRDAGHGIVIDGGVGAEIADRFLVGRR